MQPFETDCFFYFDDSLYTVLARRDNFLDRACFLAEGKIEILIFRFNVLSTLILFVYTIHSVVQCRASKDSRMEIRLQSGGGSAAKIVQFWRLASPAACTCEYVSRRVCSGVYVYVK